MKPFAKVTTVVALVGALAVPMATSSYARDGRNAAAAIGFGAGALVGAAAANATYGYGPAYYDYGPGDDTYAYEPGYAYDAAPAYEYAPVHRHYWNRSNAREHRCMLSPGSQSYVPCDNKF